ncbi:lactonase family protein [Klebsiella pneumoniae]|nr:lactonase family protein [Klebsiella pneumoniae]
MPVARHLLVASLSLFAAAAGAAQTHYAWVGTYNPNGEGLYRFTVDAKTGALRDKTLVSSLPNVAQLTVSRDGKTLYAASEVEKGVVQAWRIEKNGELTALSQVASGGAGPVYLSLTPDGKHLLVANYVSGSIAVLPVQEDGSLAEAVDRHQDEGPAGAERPAAAVEGSFAISDHNGPHAHMIAAASQWEVCLLHRSRAGSDLSIGWIAPATKPQRRTIRRLSPPRRRGAGRATSMLYATGRRPVALINEEASTLTFYHLDKQSGLLREGKTVSALPEGYKGTSFAAGLVLSNDGKQLYVANRLHNSIAHFTVLADGSLSHQEDIWTRGDYPRTLTLDNQGQWLYVMNQRSDNITRFSVAPKDGKLTFASDYTPVGSPSQMVISAQP